HDVDQLQLAGSLEGTDRAGVRETRLDVGKNRHRLGNPAIWCFQHRDLAHGAVLQKLRGLAGAALDDLEGRAAFQQCGVGDIEIVAYRVAVQAQHRSRNSIHPAIPASTSRSSTLPGLRMPLGSSSALNCCITSRSTGLRLIGNQLLISRTNPVPSATEPPNGSSGSYTQASTSSRSSAVPAPMAMCRLPSPTWPRKAMAPSGQRRCRRSVT